MKVKLKVKESLRDCLDFRIPTNWWKYLILESYNVRLLSRADVEDWNSFASQLGCGISMHAYIIYINTYKCIYIYLYIHTDIHYIDTHMLLYLSHADVAGFGIGSPTFQEEGCSQNRSFVFQYCEAWVCNLFFFVKAVVSCLSWWNTAGGWGPFVSGQKNSGA